MENQQDKWKSDELGDEASLKNEDEIKREILRGNVSEGDADERDNAGAPDTEDTPHGREETKNDTDEEENSNG